MSEEQWAPVPNCDEMYEVSSWGRVRSWVTTGASRYDRREEPVIISSVKGGSRCGPKVNLRARGIRVRFSLARMVLRLHGGGVKRGCEPEHIDGDKWNCAVGNLRWVPKGSNRRRAPARGEGVRTSKLDAEKVKRIRELADGNTVKDIAELYGVCGSTISSVINRRTWKHVP